MSLSREHLPVAPDRKVILLVDDDPSVLELLARRLKNDQLVILTAESAEDALQVLQEYPGTVHVLLTDVGLPDIDGLELGTRVASARPDIRILTMSASLAPDPTTTPLTSAPQYVAHFEKPFSVMALVDAIHAALG